MDSVEFERYLKQRYEPQITWYDRKANRNKKVYDGIQWPVIVLAAATPILVAVGGEWQRWSAVVVSALVAIGTTAIKTFKYQENWINYRTTCESLKKEIYYYRSKVDAYKDATDPEALFVERVESLISRENTLWLVSHREKKDKSKED